MMGQVPHRANIIGMTNADPCEVTTDVPHGYVSLQYVRLTDLNNAIPHARGMDEINNRRFRIIVTDVDKFTLQDPVSFKNVSSITFPPYISGGYCNLIAQSFEYLNPDA